MKVAACEVALETKEILLDCNTVALSLDTWDVADTLYALIFTA